MRIAQVSSLHESVPPAGYGGTERVVHWLTEELVRRGHDVTLFASADSRTAAKLVPVVPAALRRAGSHADASALHLAALVAAVRESPPFDLVHAHLEWLAMSIAQASGAPVLTTMHGRLDVPEVAAAAACCPDAPLVSISDAQRAPLPHARWVATVHHGLPLERVPFIREAEDYVVFVGRISPEKRPDLAIRAAVAARTRLRIAAKINGSPEDARYWTEEIRPLIDAHPDWVEFLGEVGEAEKVSLMGRARALVFPVDWPEPFGLVAIESLAFGTPVIARPYGALPEIVEDGRTGFLTETETELAAAIRAADSLSRATARAAAVRRFSTQRMVDDYERVYRRIVSETRWRRTRSAI